MEALDGGDFDNRCRHALRDECGKGEAFDGGEDAGRDHKCLEMKSAQYMGIRKSQTMGKWYDLWSMV